MRFLIFLLLIYFCYILFKSRKKSVKKPAVKSVDSVNKADDIMVYDPCCKIYYPKTNCISFKDKDKTLYFCSKECKNKFLKNKKKGEFI